MTPNDKHIPAGRRFADVLSGVFSPLFVPTYALASVLWCTSLRYIALSVRLWVLTAVFLLTAVAPAIFIAYLIRKGRASDAALSNRRERTLPFCLTIVCYLLAVFFLCRVNAPAWLTGFFCGATAVLLIDVIITQRWKISAHSSALGGYFGAIYYLARHGMLYGNALVWLTATAAVIGLVAWARLYLNRHTPAQTFAGALLAFAVIYFSMIIFNIN